MCVSVCVCAGYRFVIVSRLQRFVVHSNYINYQRQLQACLLESEEELQLISKNYKFRQSILPYKAICLFNQMSYIYMNDENVFSFVL